MDVLPCRRSNSRTHVVGAKVAGVRGCSRVASSRFGRLGRGVKSFLKFPARSNPLCGVTMVERQWIFVRGKCDSGAQRVG
jgi:hypothetical protein